MRRALFATVVMSLVAVTLSAQGRPNFSGTWTFVSSAPANAWAMGLRFMVSQDSTTLLIERTEPSQRILIADRSETPSGTPLYTPERWRELYRLDGSELKRTFTLQPSGAPTSVGTEETVSSATWQDQQLVIVTASVMVAYRADGANRSTQTVRDTLRLDTDGTLIVDRWISVDPVPGGGANATIGRPGPIRSVYQRASAR